jgi:hypothetical protein
LVFTENSGRRSQFVIRKSRGYFRTAVEKKSIENV